VAFVVGVFLAGCSSGSASKVDASHDTTAADVASGDGGAAGGKGGQSGTGGISGSGGSGFGGSIPVGSGGSGSGGSIAGAAGGSGAGGSIVGDPGAGGSAGSVRGSGGQVGGRDGGAAGNSGSGGVSGGGSTVVSIDAPLGGGSGTGGGIVGSGGNGGVTDTGGDRGSDGGIGTGIDGGQAKDAPSQIDGNGDTSSPLCGQVKGTLGGSATEASSMQRWKVSGTDCHQYVIQNNNFGNPTGSIQTVTCLGNSFEVVSSTATSTSGLASFPSIYIGANGDIANGSFVTTDSNLPIQVKSIRSVLTDFEWYGGAVGGDFNATYDVWFATNAPAPGSYNDAISGSLMVWLKKPENRHPAGSVVRQAVVAGHLWNVWVGRHGDTNTGTDGVDRPIVSYVAQDSLLASLAFDLKNFIDDAVVNGSDDMVSGGTSQAFASSWYLTDVLAGFQLWKGADAAGLKCTGFSCSVR